MMPYGSKKTMFGMWSRSVFRGRNHTTVEKKHPRQEAKREIKEQLDMKA